MDREEAATTLGICPFLVWQERHLAEAARSHPDSFIAVDLDDGVLVGARDWDAFASEVARLPDKFRRERLLITHTDLGRRLEQGMDEAKIGKDAAERARVALSRMHSDTRNKQRAVPDAVIEDEVARLIESERMAAEMRHHFVEHRRLDAEKSALLFKSCDLLIAWGGLLAAATDASRLVRASLDGLPKEAADRLRAVADGLDAAMEESKTRANRHELKADEPWR